MEELVDNCLEGAKGQEVPEIHLKLDQINDVSCKHYRMHGCHHVPLVGLSTAYAAIAHVKAWFCKAFDDISFDYFAYGLDHAYNSLHLGLVKCVDCGVGR